jgi:hypothetical protein
MPADSHKTERNTADSLPKAIQEFGRKVAHALGGVTRKTKQDHIVPPHHAQPDPAAQREHLMQRAAKAFEAGYDAAGRAYAEKASAYDVPSSQPQSFVEREMQRRERGHAPDTPSR